MTDTEHKSGFVFRRDTPYLTLTGELWGVYHENFGEKSPRYNCTALYICLRYGSYDWFNDGESVLVSDTVCNNFPAIDDKI